jgi:hypothetical protein
MKAILLSVTTVLLLCGAGPDDRKPQGPPDMGKMFDRWDANHDNLLDRTEFEAGMKQMMEHRRQHEGRGRGRDRDGGPDGDDSGLRGRRGQENEGQSGERGERRGQRRTDRGGNHANRFFEHWDADQDGVVTQAEFGGPAERFTFFDRNSDGKIERSELPAPRDDQPPPPPGE